MRKWLHVFLYHQHTSGPPAEPQRLDHAHKCQSRKWRPRSAAKRSGPASYPTSAPRWSGPAQPGTINSPTLLCACADRACGCRRKNLCMRLAGKLVLFPSYPSRELENLLPGRRVYFRRAGRLKRGG